MTDLADRVKAAARTAGFDAVGISGLEPVGRGALERWLEAGQHGTMAYMARQAGKRREPARIVPGARRAVVVLKSYYKGERATPAPDTSARVARYAWGADYHHVIGEKLERLKEELLALGATPERTRCYVDAGPVPERELAQRAGLGWIAKNTMLIHPRLGSFTFIGTVVTDLEIPVDPPFDTDRCGSCRLCLDACPTEAFPRERVLDARHCISYLTIEHRGPFSASQAPMIGDWLFGCDVCQDVCPWNGKFAAVTDEPDFEPRSEVVAHDLSTLLGLEPGAFEARYGATAFARAGADGIRRNARQVVANRGATLTGSGPL